LFPSCSLHWPEASKVKQIPSSFSKVLFISLIFLGFMRCNDALNKYAVEKELIKMVDERGEKIQMVEEGQKRKHEVTASLFSP
jgi:hypothetical protein